MTDLKDIEDSIRYSCRKMPDYGDALISKVQQSFRLLEGVNKILLEDGWKINAKRIMDDGTEGEWEESWLLEKLKELNDNPKLNEVSKQ